MHLLRIYILASKGGATFELSWKKLVPKKSSIHSAGSNLTWRRLQKETAILALCLRDIKYVQSYMKTELYLFISNCKLL